MCQLWQKQVKPWVKQSKLRIVVNLWEIKKGNWSRKLWCAVCVFIQTQQNSIQRIESKSNRTKSSSWSFVLLCLLHNCVPRLIKHNFDICCLRNEHKDLILHLWLISLIPATVKSHSLIKFRFQLAAHCCIAEFFFSFALLFRVEKGWGKWTDGIGILKRAQNNEIIAKETEEREQFANEVLRRRWRPLSHVLRCEISDPDLREEISHERKLTS